MKHILINFVAFLLSISTKAQNCISLFSYHTNFETVDFRNRSILSNAHYWWNFGDGTSSHYKDPSHTFPENGNYLVTLFIKDIISNCSDYSERWVTVTKYSEEDCSPAITDSIIIVNGKAYITVNDYSFDCEGYGRIFDVGPGKIFPIHNWIGIYGYNSARFVSRMRFTPSNISNGSIYREAYKSTPYNYNGSKNYTECSANFEFTVIAEDAGGQTIRFEAMNKNVLHYEWSIIGFGNPIITNKDTTSHYFPFYYSSNTYLIGLKTEGASGCKDTFYQDVLINPTRTNPVRINPSKKLNSPVELFPNPFSQQATLTFSNPDQLNYTLVISNMLGQIVSTINNVKNGAIIIKRLGLQSGVYFYQLRQNGQQKGVGKMVLRD